MSAEQIANQSWLSQAGLTYKSQQQTANYFTVVINLCVKEAGNQRYSSIVLGEPVLSSSTC